MRCSMPWDGGGTSRASSARATVSTALYATVPQEDMNGSNEDLDLDEAHLHEGYCPNAELAAAKAMAYLCRIETAGFLAVEKGSVYGAAVAIPQVARSVGWSTTFTGLAVRSYVFLMFNLFIQIFLLYVINVELHVMAPFAGKVHLCDFGADLSNCPEGTNCRGPGGTRYSYSRNYGFSTWSTRVFIRDTLIRLFPQRAGEVSEVADPGEYGLEDYYCRLVCCLIFMMAIVDDLKSTLGLLSMLYQVPTNRALWIRYDVPDWDTKAKVKQMHNWLELDLVKFKVGGMPLCWKFANFFVVFLPKGFIWLTLTSSGFHFLMETAGIVDLVVNCMALTFVLSIDEMVFERLSTAAAKHIMSHLEDMPLFEEPDEEHEDDARTLHRYRKSEMHSHRWRSILCFVMPKRLIIICLLMALFVVKYYLNNCERDAEGSWVSKPVYLPEREGFSANPLASMYTGLMAFQSTPFWTMPPTEAEEEEDDEEET